MLFASGSLDSAHGKLVFVAGADLVADKFAEQSEGLDCQWGQPGGGRSWENGSPAADTDDPAGPGAGVTISIKADTDSPNRIEYHAWPSTPATRIRAKDGNQERGGAVHFAQLEITWAAGGRLLA